MQSIDGYLFKKRRRVTLESFFGDRLTEDIVSKFEEDPSWDFIEESFNTYDADMFIQRLNDHFGKYIVSIDRSNKADKENFEIVCKDKLSQQTITTDEGFLALCTLFNYYVTLNSFDNLTIYMEPVESNEMTSVEFNACHGIFYHIARTSNSAYSILRNGFRCKRSLPGNEWYRDYPEKIFLCAFDYAKVNYKKELKEIAKEIGVSKNNGIVLKVDLRRADGKIYKDFAMGNRDDCYYTFDFIPPSNITFFNNLRNL